MGLEGPERERFKRHVLLRAPKAGFATDNDLMDVFGALFNDIKVRSPYEGSKDDQQRLSDFVSTYINEFITNTSIIEHPGVNGEAIRIPKEVRLQVFFLKELTWAYVIRNPALASYQLGQRRAIETLFREYNAAVLHKDWYLLPALFRDRAIELDDRYTKPRSRAMPTIERVRLVADTISSMSDQQALAIYRRFSGVSLGSVLEQIIK